MSMHNLSRRTFLRGVGVTMALPWMESLTVWGDTPTLTEPASEAPVRLAVLFAGNGFHSKEWWARGERRGAASLDCGRRRNAVGKTREGGRLVRAGVCRRPASP